MLTLLEADKRTPTEALELSYRRNESERVFVPDNLYVIGTMISLSVFFRFINHF
jgi:5-methylcytosine-specific restriction protein B